MKISNNWLTNLISDTPQTLRFGLEGAVRLQNTQMALNIIVDTTQRYPKVAKVNMMWFEMQFRAEM